MHKQIALKLEQDTKWQVIGDTARDAFRKAFRELESVQNDFSETFRMMPTDHVIQSYGEARFKAALDEYMASHATRVQAVIDACKKITNAFIVLTADDDA